MCIRDRAELFADLQVCGAAADGEILKRGRGNGQNIVRVAALQRDHAGHDLCQAGGVDLLVDVHSKQQRACVEVNQSGGFRADIKIIVQCVIQKRRWRVYRVFRGRLRVLGWLFRQRGAFRDRVGRFAGAVLRFGKNGKQQTVQQQQRQKQHKGQNACFFHMFLQKRRERHCRRRQLCVIIKKVVYGFLFYYIKFPVYVNAVGEENR